MKHSDLQKRSFKTSADRGSQPADGKPRSKFDTWLQRCAQIAQITLVIAAIAGYFYSVRPIHQKQRLDEEIAQSAADLAAVQLRLQSTYVNLRKFVVFDLRRFVYVKCTGLLEAPDFLHLDELRVDILDRDISACIVKEGLDSHKIEDLTPDDVAKLKTEFGHIAERVAILRSEAKAEVARLVS